MSITLNPRDLERAERLLKGIKGGAQKAVLRALNHTAGTVKTQMARSVTDRYHVKVKDVKSAISIKKADPQNLEARINVRSTKLGLGHFQLKPNRDTTGSPHKEVRAEVLRGTPFDTPKNGFIWHRNVFAREKEDKRLPIKKYSGPAVPQMVGSEKVMQQIEEHANEQLARRIDHEITALLEGYGKKK